MISLSLFQPASFVVITFSPPVLLRRGSERTTWQSLACYWCETTTAIYNFTPLQWYGASKITQRDHANFKHSSKFSWPVNMVSPYLEVHSSVTKSIFPNVSRKVSKSLQWFCSDSFHSLRARICLTSLLSSKNLQPQKTEN